MSNGGEEMLFRSVWIGSRSFRGLRIRFLISIVFLIIFVTIRPTSLEAQAPPRSAAPIPLPRPNIKEDENLPVGSQPHSLTEADLDAWLDGMLPAALKQGDVAGVVVSVVKDGHVLLAKGYGYSDMARRTPMDPNRTMIRPGSTSKLFTWTAVMQLVEQGKLDLNADINRYLDFRLPEPYGRRTTLNDLMTHRAGFEEGLKDALVTDPAALQPLDVYLKRHIRPVLFPPGEVPAYSNYGAALAGYIVQRASGERYDHYIARHILAPLGMRHSTFTQPLPAIPDSVMSKGYRSSADPAQPFELISFAPAGSMTTTAGDMANFMIAHLQNGRLGQAQILRPETVRLMHSSLVPAPAGFDVMAHGFFRDVRNGRMILEHGGDSIFFHSDLMILPQENVGLFFSFNSRGREDSVYGMRQRLIDGFMDRYFPGPAVVTSATLATAKDNARRIAGRYESSRRVQSGFMSLFYVLQVQQTVTPQADGMIVLSSSPDKVFREIAPDQWQEVGGSRVLALTKVGRLSTIIDSRDPVGYLQAVPLERNAGVNLAIFISSFLILLVTALAWAIAEGARRFYAQPPSLSGRALVIRRLARIAAVADIAYLVAWFFVLKPILGLELWFYTSSLDPVIRTLQVAALIPLLGAAAGVANAWLSVRSGRNWVTKAGSVTVAVALIGIVWIAYVGGLMSFTLNY